MKIGERIRALFQKVKREVKVAKGEKTKDKVYVSKRKFYTEEEATLFFKESRERLFKVNAWSQIPRPLNSTFQLYDSNGEKLSSSYPRLNDFIRIDLPGPFPENWVKVIDLKSEENVAEFTVTPSKNPIENGKSKEVEHFFDSKATSTFKVVQRGDRIYAYEIGKYETTNVKQPGAGNRPVLNVLISEGGWAFFQKIQWKNLTDYLVGKV